MKVSDTLREEKVLNFVSSLFLAAVFIVSFECFEADGAHDSQFGTGSRFGIPQYYGLRKNRKDASHGKTLTVGDILRHSAEFQLLP